MRQRVAELVRLCLLHLHRAFADNRSLMTPGAGRVQVTEDSLQQSSLKEPVRLRRHPVRPVRIPRRLPEHGVEIALDVAAAAARVLDRGSLADAQSSGIDVHEIDVHDVVADGVVDRRADDLRTGGQLAVTFEIDFELVELVRPRIDGPEFVRQVRSDPTMQGLSIFALTGMDPEELDIPTGPDGVDQWYSKPVDPKALVHDVAEYLTNLAAVA